MDTRIFLIIVVHLTVAVPAPQAGILATEKVSVSPTCPSPQALVVLTGSDVPALLGTPLEQISLLRYSNTKLLPVTFQIDEKDPEGRYLIDKGRAGTRSSGNVLESQDELVFRTADGGEQLPRWSDVAQRSSLVEIEVRLPEQEMPAWLYAGISKAGEAARPKRHIRYMPDTDAVQSGPYLIGFSKAFPFLIDSFHWNLGGNNAWSPDVTDTMKIRHQGKFLGFIPFERTQRDYKSELLAVKPGPLRVIRRTANRIRVLWRLKTPALYVDYVMMPEGFIMDTVVDIPFNIGLFFSDIETLTTMDWNDDPKLPDLTVASPDSHKPLLIDGRMSTDKWNFNSFGSSRFSVSSEYGALLVQLLIPDDFPIQPWLYLRDDISEADMPENHPGQFGNVGFRTTNWEQIDTAVHHLKFTVCIDKAH